MKEQVKRFTLKKRVLRYISKKLMIRINFVRIVNRCLWHTAKYTRKSDKFRNKGLRPMFRVLAERNNVHVIGAEVGVDLGVNAKKVLDTLSIRKLYLVDPYLSGEKNDGDDVNFLSIRKEVAHRYLEKYENVVWIQKLSKDALGDVSDTLDFIYIDAVHDYESIFFDAMSWYDKLKIGGVIGGHDFDDWHIGLKQGVRDFCKLKKMELQVEYPDWWAIKEEEVKEES